MKMNYCDFAPTFVNVESIHTLILSTSLPNVSVLKCMNVCGKCVSLCMCVHMFIYRKIKCMWKCSVGLLAYTRLLAQGKMLGMPLVCPADCLMQDLLRHLTVPQ